MVAENWHFQFIGNHETTITLAADDVIYTDYTGTL